MRVGLVRGKFHSIWESLACGYLKSYTSDLVAPEDYYFGDGYFDSDEEIIQKASECDIVGFSGTSSQMRWNLEIANAIKARAPDVRIYVGGYGPSVDPTRFLGKVDGVVVGEGEVPWREILQSGGRETGLIMRPAIGILDSIPFPDRAFIKVERCIQVAKIEEGRRVTSIFGNRGCYRRCKFCADGTKLTIYGVKLRERSPKNIADEMEQVRDDWNIQFFKFCDPEVNTRLGRNEELCEELINRKWDTPWGGNMIASPIREREAKTLYEAGCREVWIGLESGNLQVHQHIGKGVSPGTIRESFKTTKDAGLLRRAYVLMGTPLETLSTIKDTENLIDEVKPDTVSFSVLAPYPGTSYWREEFAYWDWSEIDEYGGPTNTFHPDAMTKNELLRERLRLIEKYRGNLSRIVHKKIALGIIDTGEIQLE